MIRKSHKQEKTRKIARKTKTAKSSSSGRCRPRNSADAAERISQRELRAQRRHMVIPTSDPASKPPQTKSSLLLAPFVIPLASAGLAEPATSGSRDIPQYTSPPDSLDDYVQWDLADAATSPHLVHTQPVHVVPAAALQSRLEQLESRSLSPAFSAFSDRFQDSVPELPAPDTASNIPKNPPFQLHQLIEVAAQIAEPHMLFRAPTVGPIQSPQDSFVQYITHKLAFAVLRLLSLRFSLPR